MFQNSLIPQRPALQSFSGRSERSIFHFRRIGSVNKSSITKYNSCDFQVFGATYSIYLFLFRMWRCSSNEKEISTFFGLLSSLKNEILVELTFDWCPTLLAQLIVPGCAVGWMTKPKILNIRSCMITNEHAKIMGDVFSSKIPSIYLHQIEHLSLWDNLLDDDGAAYLADSLKYNRFIQSISFGRNRISNRGAESFVDIMGRYPISPQEVALKKKSLKDGEKKKKELQTKLKKLQSSPKTANSPEVALLEAQVKLIEWNMEDNTPIEDKGAFFLVGNNRLKSLNFTFNPIQKETVEAKYASLKDINLAFTRLVL
jgi:hypothetical protein